jgi:hypothetical protein
MLETVLVGEDGGTWDACDVRLGDIVCGRLSVTSYMGGGSDLKCTVMTCYMLKAVTVYHDQYLEIEQYNYHLYLPLIYQPDPQKYHPSSSSPRQA